MSELKKTPLFEEHEKAGGRIVDFAGWLMPVQYAGIREEHDCVREKVGLFDVSHMGEIRFRGSNAVASLQWMTTNDVAKLEAGQAQYSLLPNDNGGLVDDIIVYCVTKNQDYLVCVNASNTTKDFEWMKAHNKGADIQNESFEWAQIAIQGPLGVELTGRVFGPKVKDIPSFEFRAIDFEGASCLVARTGYTGEDGFEVFVPRAQAVGLWQTLLKKGADLGVQPIGLGARDTLRTEMKYSLYGHEINDTTNPIEARLGWVVKLGKGEFVGRSHMARLKEAGVTRDLVGFRMVDKGIPREGYALLNSNQEKIGHVTSGTLSPSLNEGIGIGYVVPHLAKEGSELFVDIRGRAAKVRVVKTPFVQPKSKAK